MPCKEYIGVRVTQLINQNYAGYMESVVQVPTYL